MNYETFHVGMALLAISLFLIAVVVCARRTNNAVVQIREEVSWMPSNEVIFFELDWVCGVVKLSCTIPGHKHVVKTELHQSQLGYTILAMDMHHTLFELVYDQLMDVDCQRTKMEMASWKIIVSTTGRAHNALPMMGGQHPALLMNSALAHAFKAA